MRGRFGLPKQRSSNIFTGIKRFYSIMMSSSEKKPCLPKIIGTHDGKFHCDEVLACSLLKMLPEYSDAEIVRTRNSEKLDGCDIVVDVGGVYDPSRHRYDHHQRSFNESMASLANKKWTTKLSSAGLVYLHFGHKLLSQLLGSDANEKLVETIYDKLYENFIEEIDAVDNGVNQYDGEPRYRVTTTIGSRVGNLNPRWNENNPDPQAGFYKAMELVRSEFLDRVSYFKDSWIPAKSLVQEAIDKRFEVDSSGEIVCLANGGCPWKDYLFAIEEESNLEPKLKFVLFPDQNGNWRVQCVPVGLSSFENRLSLLEEWRGVRDAALSELSGIPGCIFVHASGFIGGNVTYEGALAMARTTLNRRKFTWSHPEEQQSYLINRYSTTHYYGYDHYLFFEMMSTLSCTETVLLNAYHGFIN